MYGGGSAAPVTDECDALSQISSIVGDLKLQADAQNLAMMLGELSLSDLPAKAKEEALLVQTFGAERAAEGDCRCMRSHTRACSALCMAS